jgi:PelA/Pel-15E family pectate lyase
MKKYNKWLIKPSFLKLSAMLVALLPAGLVKAQTGSQAQPFTFTQINPGTFGDNAGHWYGIFDKNNIINARPGRPKYKPTEITSIADNILLFQKDNGGWPKNYDIFAILTPDQKDSVIAAKGKLNTTYDNGTTYSHVETLCDVYTVTHDEKYKAAALKGFDFILASQYKNGGWPQYYPLENNYSRCITFNDGVFAGILELLGGVDEGEPQYAFLDAQYRKKLKDSYAKGLDCIVKAQIVDDGKLTAWCQQHDPVTLAPAWARAFEPPSICNQESANLVVFLMGLPHPTKQIITAIKGAAAWFRESEIQHTVVKTIPAPRLVTPFRVSTADRVVVDDPNARPIWTRYYELKTHRPLFCNRDSKVVYSLAEVDRERRDGYAWYTYAPQKVLDMYPEWEKKFGGK